ncbi:MAG: phosphatase PAP2 family protein [Xanthobacteraceae bacterium]
MNRTGLMIALAVAVVVGVVFGLWPELDLRLVAPFFDADHGGFWRSYDPLYLRLRDGVTWLIALLALPGFVALGLKLLRPGQRALIPARAAVLMIATLALGPGVLTNLVLKDHWGRPRPIDVSQFGGTDEFRAWWDPRGSCPKNCSFVAGEPSGAFWTLAPAMLVPAPWRVIATLGALSLGAAVGLLRMAAGAHFFTDVVFAGLVTFLLIWVTHGMLYRWPRTPMSNGVGQISERVIRHLST